MLTGMRTSRARIILLGAMCLLMLDAGLAIAQDAARGRDTSREQDTASGHWSATLRTAEHTIAFGVEIPDRPGAAARITMGFPCTATATSEGNADEVTLTFPRNESRITATRIGDSLYGEWRRERIVDGQSIVERIPFEATRLSGGGCAELSEVAPLPTRWVSEPDECGSSATYSIDTSTYGDVMVRSVGPDGRIVSYPGSWSPRDGTLFLTRFDGVEAQVIHATRQPDGSFEGQVWTGPNMPERWVIRPAAREPKVDAPTSTASDAISASDRLRLIP